MKKRILILYHGNSISMKQIDLIMSAMRHWGMDAIAMRIYDTNTMVAIYDFDNLSDGQMKALLFELNATIPKRWWEFWK